MTPHSDLNVNKASIVDPNGFLFKSNEKLLRAIYPSRKVFYSHLLNNQNFKKISSDYNLVPTRLYCELIPELPEYLLLEHEIIQPLNYCTEWSFSMLKDAATLTLNLAHRLLDEGMTLQDAYPWNVVFNKTKPVFVDYTSVVENDHVYLWKAHQQFLNFFYHPLILMSQGKGRFVRHGLTECIDGISANDVLSLSNFSYWCKHPGEGFSFYITSKLNNYFNSHQDTKQKLKKQVTEKLKSRKLDVNLQKNFFLGLKKKIDSLRAPSVTDFWQEYYTFQDPRAAHNKKTEFINRFFSEDKSDTVLDLGCNTGRFSILAAQNNKQVTSVDGSDDCIEGLYAFAKKENLSITPMVVNLSNPTAGYGFSGNQFASFSERVKSDVVLCLGLMHHLHINGRQPFSNIISFLNSLCKKTLVFEYVDKNDANNEFLDSGREINYDINSVMKELNKYFTVESFESDRDTRKLFVCRKK